MARIKAECTQHLGVSRNSVIRAAEGKLRKGEAFESLYDRNTKKKWMSGM
jgi:hypothetical protein